MYITILSSSFIILSIEELGVKSHILKKASFENTKTIIHTWKVAPLWEKIVRLKKNRSPTNGYHKWETTSESTESGELDVNGLRQTDIRIRLTESMESVERNVNGLHQTDIRIRLRDKSFHLWDLFDGEK